MNNITMKMNADNLIMLALQEDITSEDITTNSVMREYQLGEVELICKEFGISKTSLYLLSQEHFGTGITLYIRQRRMEKAMQLLEEKAMPISDVAQAVGYMDASYFTRAFRQHTGCTPTKWRKA